MLVSKDEKRCLKEGYLATRRAIPGAVDFAKCVTRSSGVDFVPDEFVRKAVSLCDEPMLRWPYADICYASIFAGQHVDVFCHSASQGRLANRSKAFHERSKRPFNDWAHSFSCVVSDCLTHTMVEMRPGGLKCAQQRVAVVAIGMKNERVWQSISDMAILELGNFDVGLDDKGTKVMRAWLVLCFTGLFEYVKPRSGTPMRYIHLVMPIVKDEDGCYPGVNVGDKVGWLTTILLLNALANATTPCGYVRVQGKALGAYGPPSVHKKTANEDLICYIEADTVHKVSTGNGRGELAQGHRRRGHTRYLWYLRGIDRFKLPRSLGQRLRLAADYNVPKRWIGETWVGPRRFTDEDGTDYEVAA